MGNIKREYLAESEWVQSDLEGDKGDFERITFLKSNQLTDSGWWGDNWKII